MRTVEYQFTQSDLETLIAQTSYADVNAALGRLTTWAMDMEKYAEVTIWLNLSANEINANYREGIKINYSIGAVWHTDHFGFHS